MLLLLSNGEYSDYTHSGPYRLLKPLVIAEAAAEFVAQWKPDPERPWHDGPSPDNFGPWLLAVGYIEEIPCVEIHCGGYGRFEVSEETAALRLEGDA
jgi:hypothetical protein